MSLPDRVTLPGSSHPTAVLDAARALPKTGRYPIRVDALVEPSLQSPSRMYCVESALDLVVARAAEKHIDTAMLAASHRVAG